MGRMEQFLYKAGIAVFLMALVMGVMQIKPILAFESNIIFSDISRGSWALQSIEAAVSNGLMSGMGDGVFGYGEPITRAQFVTILSNMFEWNENLPLTPTFTDVLPEHWFYNYVEAAATLGVIYSGGSFNPNAPISRQDMAVMLVKALGYSSLAAQVERFEPNPFVDVSSYRGYITIAHDIGMVGGVGEGRFAPDNTATREQAAAMLVRVFERLNTSLDWVHGFYAFGSFAQRELIRDMDAVSFGWSALEWDFQNGVRLNTSSQGGNPWAIPAGYELIVNYPRDNGATAHLNVFMDNTMGLNGMIADEASRRRAVDLIIDEATRAFDGIGRSPFDGVTINFEELRGMEARANFNAFLTELAQGLRAANRSLFVTVHAATIDGVYFDGYDLRTIGQLADRVILMAHDYHPRSLDGLLGTSWQRNAALTPIAEIYRALKVITDPITGVQDRSKIAVAFSFPNIGWFIDNNGNAVSPTPIAVSMETVLMRMSQPDTYFGWSETFRNPFIIYTTDAGERVFLWYENSQSVYEKLMLARLFEITGASVWRMGIIPNEPTWNVWENFVH